MSSLTRKLLRDLNALKGQAAAITVVIGAGVMVLILSVSTLDALRLSQQRFYESHHFADVFVNLERAPEGVAERLRVVPGVNQLETRVRAPVRLEVPGFSDPVRGLLVSLPDGRQPNINRLFLRAGRLPDAGRSDQVVISEPFSEAHGLHAGDRLRAIINGRLQTLTVSGVALSPEFVYQIGPADLLPDYKRFTVLWMNRRALGHAYGMDGAFNSVVLTLQAGVEAEPVLDAVDEILAPHGSVGAYSREDHISHRFLAERIRMQRVMAVVLTSIFLGVSAFLLNVLVARVIRIQRQQIAVLKAFGYSNAQIAAHYGQFTAAIVVVGTLLGVIFGAWAGESLARLYAEYFRFPALVFAVQPRMMALSLFIAAAAAAAGVGRAVYGAVRLPPAEAMRPPAPESFHRGWWELSAFGRMLAQPTRIIARNLSRHRVKASLSVLGIGLSAALLLVGSYQFNAVDHMLDVQYRLVQKTDVHVPLTDPTSERVVAELRHAPGVTFVETYRSVPVRLRHAQRSYRTTLLGLDEQPRLRGLLDESYAEQRLPPHGLLLTDYLAAHLGLRPGDRVEVEVMEGRRPRVSVELAGVVREPVGVGAYMERRQLNRLMGEGPAVDGAWLLADRSRDVELFDHLWAVPRVASIGLVADAERTIRDYVAETILVIMSIMVMLAASIAFAVGYNNARVNFAERARELATLRVLGFSRGEVGWILFGETFLLTLAAIPLGWVVGTGLAGLLNEAMRMDLMRIPFLITSRTYAFSAGGVIVAATLSTLLIARRLRQLDMVAALKTIE